MRGRYGDGFARRNNDAAAASAALRPSPGIKPSLRSGFMPALAGYPPRH
jgi:hypothetical protein